MIYQDLWQKIMLDPVSDDPTDLQCQNCLSFYSMNAARVRRALDNPTVGDPDTPKLCWVCVRLKNSASQGACA